MLKCAVIISTLNEERTIGNLIDSLKEDEYQNKVIIVVDGGSTDRTVKIAEERGAIVLKETGPKSLPNSRNQGAKFAITRYNADVLCFLDGDLIISPNFVKKGMEHFNKDKDVVAVRTLAGAVRKNILMKIYSPIKDVSKLVNEKSTAPPPPAHFYRREVFERCGGFDILGFREDWVFYNKVREFANQHNKKIILEKSCIRYGQFNSFTEFLKQQEWYGRTFIPYLKHVGIKEGIRDALVLKSLIYVISLVFLLLFFFQSNIIFLILGMPFFVEICLICYKSLKYKSVYILPNLFLSAMGNLAFLFGILKYLGGNKELSRGV